MDSAELLAEALQCLGFAGSVPADAFLKRPSAALLDAVLHHLFVAARGAAGKQVRLPRLCHHAGRSAIARRHRC